MQLRALIVVLLLLAAAAAQDPPADETVEPAPPPPVTEPMEEPAPPPAAESAGQEKLPVLAPGDEVIFVRDGDLWAVRSDGEGLRQLTRTPQEREIRPMASPDGTAIAYESYDSDRGDYGIWSLPTSGGVPQLLIEAARQPCWSPDGGRLAFAMQRGGSLDIWLASRQGTDLIRVLNTPEQEYLPVWSPGGERLAFVREIAEGGRTRYVLTVRDALGQEEELVALLGRAISSLSWAPSGRILYSAPSEGAEPVQRVYMIDPGHGPEELTSGLDGAQMPTWSPHANGFVYVESRHEQSRLMFRKLGGNATPVPGTQNGDVEPAVLPGPSTRAPQIYVLGQRSFYLPVPILRDDDVLIPAAELADQLGLFMKVEGDKLVFTNPDREITIDPAQRQAEVNTKVGQEIQPLVPGPELVAGVVMLPLKHVAALFGLHTEWQDEARILRIGGKQERKADAAG